jgi:GNAT superfamily N-acetyltransferase
MTRGFECNQGKIAAMRTRKMLKIRPFHADDLEELYKISLATGFAGGDASHLYADPRLLGHIYSAPYACLEPQLALVAEDSEGLGGFAVGTIDTTAWEQKLERAWWPQLRKQYAIPSEAEVSAWTDDQRRIFMIHRPAVAPVAVAGKFPTHLHLNLLPRLQRRGIGKRLFNEWLDVASKCGAGAMHVAINHANVGAQQFWSKMGFADLRPDQSSAGRTIWKGRL